MTETARQQRNAARLAELHPVFRRRVETIIRQLEADGYRPRIQQAWRSVKEQLALVEKGTSKVKWGFHNATADDGTPEALAVDLLNDDTPIVPPMRYLLKLAAHALRVQCETGILWGLSNGPRENLDAAIREGNWAYVGPRGWDPTHCQPSDLTLADARKGSRPLA